MLCFARQLRARVLVFTRHARSAPRTSPGRVEDMRPYEILCVLDNTGAELPSQKYRLGTFDAVLASLCLTSIRLPPDCAVTPSFIPTEVNRRSRDSVACASACDLDTGLVRDRDRDRASPAQRASKKRRTAGPRSLKTLTLQASTVDALRKWVCGTWPHYRTSPCDAVNIRSVGMSTKRVCVVNFSGAHAGVCLNKSTNPPRSHGSSTTFMTVWRTRGAKKYCARLRCHSPKPGLCGNCSQYRGPVVSFPAELAGQLFQDSSHAYVTWNNGESLMKRVNAVRRRAGMTAIAALPPRISSKGCGDACAT